METLPIFFYFLALGVCATAPIVIVFAFIEGIFKDEEESEENR